MKRTPIRFGEIEVPYLYGVDCADEIADAMLEACPDVDAVVLVVDRQALEHATPLRARLSQRLRVEPFVVDATEQNKTLPLVQEALELATRTRASRRTVVAAMGGGLVGNVAGLMAALLYRGVRLVHLPTTPVAAFDSTLSVKQAVNLSNGKNLCGTYHPPTLIAVDLMWLRSIPHRELLTGLAEMAKNVLAVVPDREPAFSRAVADLPDDPSTAFAALCEIGLAAKRPFLERDPQERREALIFEYGHTVGHAFEFLSRGRISHGEAVGWGMLVAAHLSRKRGHLDDADAARHHRLTAMLGLSRERIVQAVRDHDAVGEILLRDNKRGYITCRSDEIPMVLLRAGGGVVPGANGYPLVPVAHTDILAAIEDVIWAPAVAGTGRVLG